MSYKKKFDYTVKRIIQQNFELLHKFWNAKLLVEILKFLFAERNFVVKVIATSYSTKLKQKVI